jgi:hypothetical protein
MSGQQRMPSRTSRPWKQHTAHSGTRHSLALVHLNAPDETHRARTTVRSAPYPLGSMSFAHAGARTSRNVASSRLPSYPSQLQMGPFTARAITGRVR